MAFRQILIESPAHISVKNHQLIIRTDREHTVPVEDIGTVLLESRRSTITTAALSLLGQSGCAVFVCDDKHIPCAVLAPFSQHSRQPAVINRQLRSSEPLKKRLWQQIVMAKIRNQAICLRLCGQESAAKGLEELAKTVHSGDSHNVEAVAAQRYFPLLFGKGFTRADDNLQNTSLNYGYAIIRGYIARLLATYGFLPALGLHHCSELNAFNLADDLMEPFRPLIDLLVAVCFTDGDEFTPQHKRLLLNTLNLNIEIGKKHFTSAYAMELTVQSFSRSLVEKQAALSLPTLLPLEQHRYE